jgi:hypothetical protein
VFNRYGVFNKRRDTVFPFAPAIPIPAKTDVDLQKIDRNVVFQEQTEARKLEFAAIDTSFVRYNQISGILFPAPFGFVNVLSFTVPPGRVLSVNRVQYWLSEPLCYVNGQFEWQLSVDSSQIPFQNGIGNSGFTVPLNAIDGKTEISPVVVQSNATVTVQIWERLTDFVPGDTLEDYLAVACYIYGELKKPIGGK